jgi:tetratricopeptide (TPR) repeat protein
MQQRALAGTEKALGPNHTSTLDTVNNLGNLYADQGKLDEAEEMYRRALAGREKALGPDHTSTLNTVNNLGLLYADQGKLDEAEKTYQRALAGKEKALGTDHTSTLDMVNNLGLLYRDQGKLDVAEKMYQRALARKEKALGADHMSTLNTAHNLCATLASRAWTSSQSEEVNFNQSAALSQLIKLVYVSGGKHVTLFRILGRILLWSSDLVNAQITFQQMIELDNGIWMHANIQCDGCQLPISCSARRFVCNHCLDGDLCGLCFRSHEAGSEVVSSCRNHHFSEVAPDTPL